MISFTGPETVKTPHSRLLYKKYGLKEGAIMGLWSELITECDQFIDQLPRMERANEHSYIYFFGPEAKEFWIGREIIGDLPKSDKNWFTFDAFRGEALSWEIKDQKLLFDESIDLQRSAEQLHGLAGESLSKTWRVRISPLEIVEDADQKRIKNPVQISFQFFKTH